MPSVTAVARGLGVAVAVILLLYEPVLVWRTGSTLGHTWTNLRVIDDRGGHLSFAKGACPLSLSRAS